MGDGIIESVPRIECFPTNNESIFNTNDDGKWVHEYVDEYIYAF